MRLDPHLLLEVRHVAGVPLVPHRQGGPPTVADGVGVVAPEFLAGGLLVIVREVAEKKEREHVVAKIVRVHRPAELIGDGPECFAKLFLVLISHGSAFGWGATGASSGTANPNLLTTSVRILLNRSLLSSTISTGSAIAYLPWLNRFKARL